MTRAEIDAAQCRNDYERKLAPIPLAWSKPTAQIERDLRWLARQLVRELHQRPWLAGHEWRDEVAHAQRAHSASIRRERA